MQQQFKKLRKVIATSTLCLVLAPFCLAKEKTLQSDSPFLPPGYGKKQAPPPPPTVQQGEIARNLQLRGIMRMKGTYSFSFFDKKSNKSFWIKEQTTSVDGYTVGSYNPSTKTVSVTKGGASEQVTLISTSNQPQMVNKSVSVGKTVPPIKTTTAKPPANNQNKTARTIPRRRVILPKK